MFVTMLMRDSWPVSAFLDLHSVFFKALAPMWLGSACLDAIFDGKFNQLWGFALFTLDIIAYLASKSPVQCSSAACPS